MPICFFAPDQGMDGLGLPHDTERLLRCLGATGKLVGFRYVMFMVEQVLEDPDRIQLITKRLYPDTGHLFGVSAVSVERAVRNLIHFCWDWTDHSFLEYVAGIPLHRAPSNSEFIDMLAGYLRHFR
ncbi:MAG: sporulation initiation factor Spo0A C-terminal domain-containing protein [Oscillibacter ruminantium]|uniref:sporulation initiation factor Spo0A C-terminal domain-containing protein n=1 Tax=Oscillibacter ruminantium TaxID=1263547 RepID=UPI002B2080CA|nr:sporulation initiation factor Spo0A C-terminal domain-containing protein [Oscillibacter ruminantium]MEA5042161.1 sporulation initiation factor Spo0A C-terminal domain-containing protein [Oscillibacter ruminantium]